MINPATDMHTKTVRDEVLSYCRRCDPDPAHALHVAKIAVELFDELKKMGLHKGSYEYRALLEYGALLHDIGWVNGQKQHHKSAFTMIRESPLPLTSEEKHIVALVALYHRKAEPGDQPEFQALAEPIRDIVSKLAAIIRIADGLDRLHDQKLTIRKIAVRETVVEIGVAGSSLKLIPHEVMAKKTAYFKKAFTVPVLIVASSE